MAENWSILNRRQTCRLRMSEPLPGPFRMNFFASAEIGEATLNVGLRTGATGVHTSRTIMLSELAGVFAAVSAEASRSDYAVAIIQENCLQKPTVASRRATNQRLAELYTLDPTVPIFRILRRLWDLDVAGRPLLALLAALARDPLLRATAVAVIPLLPGSEFQRDQMRNALKSVAGDRLKEAVIEKVMRNAASSWTQSGHLQGRTFKIRQLVQTTPATVALALFLAYAAGIRGDDLFTSGWMVVLDSSATAVKSLAFEAKRLGLIDLRIASGVVELNVDRLYAAQGRAAHGTS